MPGLVEKADKNGADRKPNQLVSQHTSIKTLKSIEIVSFLKYTQLKKMAEENELASFIRNTLQTEIATL